MMQKVDVIGNLGKDPESRTMPNGESVVTFSVAANRKNAAGESETAWFRVSVFGKMAEPCMRFLKKGRQVFVEGELRFDPATGGPRVWTDNQGQTRASFEVTARNVKFLGQKPEGSNGGGYDQTLNTEEPF